MSFELIVQPGAEPWVPHPRCLSRLRSRFDDPTMTAILWPRDDVAGVIGKQTKPYAFRAFTRQGISHLFVDRTETPDSICWLMGHELSHQVIGRDNRLQKAFNEARARGINPASDRFHHVDPAERFCDGIATKLTGQRLDRDWWRKRVDSLQEAPRLVRSG